ncbi:MAG: 50S ribosomal protein L7/L12 [Coxiella endosymbiont of Haemaphysalis qinghaiensis]
MAQMTKKDILEAVSNMSVMDVVDLVKMMEEKFGVSAKAAVAFTGPIATGGEGVVIEEKTKFNIKMTSFGDKKIGVIKAIRSITGLGLKEAKDLVESVPSVVKEGVNKEESEKIKKELEEAGAKVELE